MIARARECRAAGQGDDALRLYRQAAEIAPGEAAVAHGLAALLGDMSHFAEAEEWAARAVRAGGSAESLLVLARARQANGDLEAAERTFEQALEARPIYIEAHRDLAQLRWMLTADIANALDVLDRQIARQTGNALALMELKAAILLSAELPDRADEAIDQAIALAPDRAQPWIMRSRIAARQGRAEDQLAAATEALQRDRASADAAKAALEALLHLGRAAEAEQLAVRILQAHPGDQGVVALLTTAWRLQGDPRHDVFCAAPGLVSSRIMEPPPGWDSLPAFLADLAAVLLRRHRWKSHPLDQSLRHGSQTQEDLTQADDPVLRALFEGLRPLVARHVAALGHGQDPVRLRSNGHFRFGPAWSVALSPGGYHADHVHPRGWMSSAFYVDLPDAMQQGRAGWLALGRPGIPTHPVLEPLDYIRPEPGMLAIFPSYMWHGTEMFSGNQRRLTVAFDIMPGK